MDKNTLKNLTIGECKEMCENEGLACICNDGEVSEVVVENETAQKFYGYYKM